MIVAPEFTGHRGQSQVFCPQPESCQSCGSEQASIHISDALSHQPVMLHQPEDFSRVGARTSRKGCEEGEDVLAISKIAQGQFSKNKIMHGSGLLFQNLLEAMVTLPEMVDPYRCIEVLPVKWTKKELV